MFYHVGAYVATDVRRQKAVVLGEIEVSAELMTAVRWASRQITHLPPRITRTVPVLTS
jgi:hypothetical protein